TVAEALWKGKPVVASSVGGIPLQVIDGETGFLVEPDDKEGFARRIVEILRAGNEVGEMAVKAREHVKRNFLVTRLLQDYLGLIGELL
ncbi:MAG: glycosyltransferase, partial [Anaerolineales bacterium]|nr:glycosyltransferase [Anaerolineales bacterium]